MTNMTKAELVERLRGLVTKTIPHHDTMCLNCTYRTWFQNSLQVILDEAEEEKSCGNCGSCVTPACTPPPAPCGRYETILTKCPCATYFRKYPDATGDNWTPRKKGKKG